MPIDGVEFEKGRKITGVERTVLQFLRQNRSRAFTQSEILGSLYRMDTSNWTAIARGVISALAVDRALSNMTNDRTVRAKQIDGQTYYKAA